MLSVCNNTDISRQFHQRLRARFTYESRNVTRKSCQKERSYKKSAQKTLMILTPGLRISNIPFPSVVICSQGSDYDGFSAALFKVIFENLKNKTALNMTRLQPIRFQKYRFNRDLRKVCYSLPFLRRHTYLSLRL
jgi:hypothetical protein